MGLENKPIKIICFPQMDTWSRSQREDLWTRGSPLGAESRHELIAGILAKRSPYFHWTSLEPWTPWAMRSLAQAPAAAEKEKKDQRAQWQEDF